MKESRIATHSEAQISIASTEYGSTIESKRVIMKADLSCPTNLRMRLVGPSPIYGVWSLG